MDDKIYRQAAIDTLTRLEPSFRGSVLEQALKNMPSAQPHWIPCSERLPSEGDTVLLSENYAYSIGRLIKTTTWEYEWSVNG